jgi:hypothetical protein
MQQTLLGLVIVQSKEGLIAGTVCLTILTCYELASGIRIFSRQAVIV